MFVKIYNYFHSKVKKLLNYYNNNLKYLTLKQILTVVKLRIMH